MKRTVLELFAVQMRERPDAPAIIAESGVGVSYRDLDASAGRLRVWLEMQGVHRGDAVALRLGLGPDLVAAILAIRRIGATLVALDDLIPAQRIAQMCATATTAAIIDQDTCGAGVDRIGGTSRSEIAAEAPNDAFAILFTSGSTGNPKGVILPTEAVVNRLEWMWIDYPFAADEVALAWKSPSLVASTWEVLGGLLAGIPTVYATATTLLDESSLLALLRTFAISRMSLTPPLLESLVRVASTHPDLTARLKLVTCGADALPIELARAAREALPETTLLHLYGLTECASNVASFNIAALSDDDESVPIGSSIGANHVRIVDKWGRKVPPGVTGEIVVTGAAVALGYLERDAGASEREPFSTSDGERSFATGDLARYRPDGEIELLGRLDNQLDVNGYRIEPEEIEGWLNRLAGVSGSAVAHDTNTNSLVALVESREKLDKSVALALLRSMLPPYMVPRRILVVTALPRTRTGKLNRHALAELVVRAQSGETKRRLAVEQLTANERVVYTAWCELLGEPPGALDDDFFEQGGHSLLAIRLVGLVRARCRTDLMLRAVMESAKFFEIVAAVDGAQRRGAAEESPSA